MRLNDITVRDWGDLQERLFQNAWNRALGRFRSPYAFRGLSDKSYELSSSLVRLGGRYTEIEQALLRNFRKYAPPSITRGDSIWEWMSAGQHHGLPTRLMDWTYSPYVALHFATANTERFDRDGVIWCVDFARSAHLLPEKLKHSILDERSNVFTVELLRDSFSSLRSFDATSKDVFVVFLEPPSLDDRIVNQFALFSLMSSPRAVLGRWLSDRRDLYSRIIIPAGLKREIRDKLDQANINERMLFPGPDGLCAWLKRYYGPPYERIEGEEY